MGKVHIEVSVITRNFDQFGVRMSATDRLKNDEMNSMSPRSKLDAAVDVARKRSLF